MKGIKKLLCALLVLTMILAFAACGEKAEAPAEPEAPAAEAPAEVEAEAAVEEAEETIEDYNYPNQNLNVIVPFAAGGGTDLGARLMLKYFDDLFPATVAVTNIAGGGSEIGITQCLNSGNDGYWISNYTTASTMLTATREAAFDPLTDIMAICLQANDPIVFAARPDESRFTTFEEMIQYAKDHPGELILGDSGAGSVGDFSTAALAYMTGAEFTSVHLGGTAESKAALIGGHVDIAVSSQSTTTTMMQNGQAIAMGSLTEKPIEGLNCQCSGELGIELYMNSARGFIAPAGTPEVIVEYLDSLFGQVAENPDYLEEMAGMNIPVDYRDHVGFNEMITSEKALFDELCSVLDFGG